MLIKCGREEVRLNSEDVIYDNSFAVQIVTRRKNDSIYEAFLHIPRPRFSKLVKSGELVLTKEEYQGTTNSGKEVWDRYYKIKEA